VNRPESKTVPVQWRVHRRRQETADTVTLEIRPPAEVSVDPDSAGRFNMLYAFGAGEVPISISGVLFGPDRVMHTIRAVGAATRALTRLKPGQVVGVRGPFGCGWPEAAARHRDVVLVAGGLGMAPLRPALCRILSKRSEFGRVTLLFGVRTPDDLLFRKDLKDWQAADEIDIAVTVDSAPVGWPGKVGLVTRLISQLRLTPGKVCAMVCGPEIMMRFAVWELLQHGIDPEDIFLSLERNMQCGAGLCGHCQYGRFFVCKDGPVFSLDRIADYFYLREL